MMWQASGLVGYGLVARDGSIGSVTDLLFDDETWTLRWAVIETGEWLTSRKVLLPPFAFGRPDVVRRIFPVDLTREQIKHSPGLETDAPVSRQVETDLYGHYGWAPYWYPGDSFPGNLTPAAGASGLAAGPASPRTAQEASESRKQDPHLRSTNEVTGYSVRATDDAIGHVEEFLIEDDSWAVRYLVVDTKNWWPGKMVLVAPQWIESVSWGQQQVRVGLTREQVKNSPEYDPSTTVDRAYEERLYRHYSLPVYWGE